MMRALRWRLALRLIRWADALLLPDYRSNLRAEKASDALRAAERHVVAELALPSGEAG